MKIDLSKIDTENFYLNQRPTILGNGICYLITPKYSDGDFWTKDNIIFRSSVWDFNGNLISASFKKFFNWTQKPDLFPDPQSLKNVNILEKIDGSLIISSKGFIRTRGTVDARTLDNGNEITWLEQKHPKAFYNHYIERDISLLYEWVTPSNKIVLDYPESDIYLVGAINHNDYSYFGQTVLDDIALELGVQRPKHYLFNSIQEMIETTQAFKGVEGVCVYYHSDQEIKKLKGIEYLAKHKFKSEMSLKNMIEYYFQTGMPRDFTSFMSQLEKDFDYEIAQMAIGEVSKIIDGMKTVSDIITHMGVFVLNNNLMNITRKTAASIVLSSYGQTGRSGVLFSMLDHKPISDKQYKMLLYQVIGEN